MILDNGFQVLSMFDTAQLVVFHDKLDQPLVLPYTLHDWLEVALELIARKINLSQLIVGADERLSDDIGRLEAHALISKGQSIFPLSQRHLSDESLL